MQTFFIAVLVIASVIIIATTTMMEPKSRSGSAFGQESSNVYGTSVHRTKDHFLNKITVGAAVIFVLSLIAILAL